MLITVKEIDYLKSLNITKTEDGKYIHETNWFVSIQITRLADLTNVILPFFD